MASHEFVRRIPNAAESERIRFQDYGLSEHGVAGRNRRFVFEFRIRTDRMRYIDRRNDRMKGKRLRKNPDCPD
jgi:hypothetical protein